MLNILTSKYHPNQINYGLVVINGDRTLAFDKENLNLDYMSKRSHKLICEVNYDVKRYYM